LLSSAGTGPKRQDVRFQLRDHQGASRFVAYLMLAAGPLNLVTGVLLVPQTSLVSTLSFTGLCAALTAIGAICRWWPERVPRSFWLVAPFFAIVLVTGLNLSTRDASTGAQLFYLWPVIYSASFLSRTVITTTLVLVSAGDAVVVFGVLGPTRGSTDWVSLTVAFSLTAVVVASLRTRNERLREVLETQAYADPLTGVANRRSFDDDLARGVAWSDATGRPIALLTMDIDHFKRINDTWGHAVGDLALQQVADVLRRVARREDDVVARLGGDEFVVLLRTDRLGGRRAADEIRAAVALIDSLPAGPPGLSIGVAVLPDHAGTAGELLKASDTALYAAKSAGRGRTAMAHPPTPTAHLGEAAAVS
jgi:diguanylate cyclase (GGDEF)-like protein